MSVSTLAGYCPLRGWFFQRYREPLSLAAKRRLFSHQWSQPARFQPARIPRSTNVNGNPAAVYELVPLPSGLCQPFNTHRSSIQGRFSPIRF
jgi:secreted protein with Ig-like and vWFA domain